MSRLRFTYSTRSSLRPGFSLMEMAFVALVLIVMGMLLLRNPTEAPTSDLHDTAHWLSASLAAAREEAILGQREARLRVESSGGASNQGRFSAYTAAAGSSGGVPPEGSWIDLDKGIEWGYAPATLGPMGEAITAAIPTVEIICNSSGSCDLGPSRAIITYYLRAVHTEKSVRAVTVTSSGDTRVWVYNPNTQSWE